MSATRHDNTSYLAMSRVCHYALSCSPIARSLIKVLKRFVLVTLGRTHRPLMNRCLINCGVCLFILFQRSEDTVVYLECPSPDVCQSIFVSRLYLVVMFNKILND